MKLWIYLGLLSLAVAGCGRLDHVGKTPDFSPANRTSEHNAMMVQGLPRKLEKPEPTAQSSLWSRSQSSLFGDRRAMDRGDILTVVIEIDESAEISNTSDRSRSSNESLAIPNLLGIPQRNTALENAVGINSSGSSSGSGSVKRNEKLTLRVAATITDVLPNGVVAISGSQEVRVNFELRELLVTGYVRPEDISRKNEITYDKIASARVSYGGRGHISDVQQPRTGQQLLDIILPF